jgi:hypothetical protein
MKSTVGTWQLCFWSALWGHELPIVENAVERFLYQEISVQFDEASTAGDASGSLLTIHENGRFCQHGQGSSPVLTYDTDGVQVAGVAEFDGQIHDEGERSFLISDKVPTWAIPKDLAAQMRIRYDDGDTKVCDSAKFLDGQLVRQISVVTDELYGDRIVLVYNRG